MTLAAENIIMHPKTFGEGVAMGFMGGSVQSHGNRFFVQLLLFSLLGADLYFPVA